MDAQPRPAPEGHGDLSKNWVGAGHLNIGDQIKQADGTTGLVANVTTVQQTREMFNLTVSEAHTYYVGQEGWLVHNCGPSLTRWGYTGTKDYDAVVNATSFRAHAMTCSMAPRKQKMETVWLDTVSITV